MDNPYKPSLDSNEEVRLPSELPADERSLVEPTSAYTANGNLEAHSVVAWLESNGVPAHAVEDNSGVSLFAFGTISQFHKPQVFVNKADLQQAHELLRQFESQRQQRRMVLDDAPRITSVCEECGEPSEFPASQDGTTQNCPRCNAFMDVGTFEWPEDFDFSGSEPEDLTDANVDDAIDAALALDQSGEWELAIAAYDEISKRWPEHANYATNCIAELQRKLDTSQ